MIKQYKTKNNEKLWEFRAYGGTDAFTGKKQYIHRRGFKTQKAASLAESRAEVNVADGVSEKPSNMTFDGLYQIWLEGYRSTVRDTTVYAMTKMIENHMLPVLGRKKLTAIQPPMVQRLVNGWSKYSKNSYSIWIGALRRLFEYGVQLGYIATNPAKYVKMPRSTKQATQEKPKFWTKKELLQFLGGIDQKRYPEQFAFFRTLSFGGFRVGEVKALTWGDIDFGSGTISITKTVVRPSGKGFSIHPPKSKAGIRTVSMDTGSLNILRRWRVAQLQYWLARGINVNGDSQLVFSSVKNNFYLMESTPRHWLDKFSEKAGMKQKIVIHGFRHTCASMMFASGANVKQVQTRLGHSSAQTTLNIYSHVSQEQDENAVNKLVEYLEA